jgi:hypothetical protein
MGKRIVANAKMDRRPLVSKTKRELKIVLRHSSDRGIIGAWRAEALEV